jgi:hypothetical protein
MTRTPDDYQGKHATAPGPDGRRIKYTHPTAPARETEVTLAHQTIRKMGEPSNIRVHLANEHAIDPATAPRGYDVEHWHAHAYGTYREGKFHYHAPNRGE